MRNSRFYKVLPPIGLILLVLLMSQGWTLAAQAQPMGLVTSIPPLGDFARQIGGKDVRVTVLVKPGENPHILNFKPAQLRALDKAQVLVLNGLGLEFWSRTLVNALDNAELIIVHCAEGLLESVDHKAEEENAGASKKIKEKGHEEHAHEGQDPHVWLDPVYAVGLVDCIRDVLIQVDPKRAGRYSSRAASLSARLATLHQDFVRVLAPARGRTILSFHEGYGHLARRYGLRNLGVVEGFTDLEPTPGRMAKVIREVRRLRVKAIFAEPQFSSRTAQVIAQETGARVAFLDPLGGVDGEGYEAMMRRNLAELSKALLE